MPPQCLRTAKKRYEDKVLDYRSRYNKYEILEIELRHKKDKLRAIHESIDKLIEDANEKKEKIASSPIRKSLNNLDLDSSSSSSSNKNSLKDLNNTLEDVATITEQLKSSSLSSEEIDNKENDPSTSSNVYLPNSKPIQTILVKPNEFKLSSDGRRFNAEYYKTYQWLEFSLIKNKIYCFCCRMFNPFCALKDGIAIDSNYTKKIKNHNDSKMHQTCMERWKTRQLMDKNKNSIASQTNSHHSAEVKKNRENLTIVIQILIFLAKQGLPLRAHDESENSKNKGNFLELIDLIASFVPSFKKFIENNSYLHHTFQNELIEILANQLIRKILPKEYFSIILDETMDVGKDEQIAFCMRYVEEDLEIHEYLLILD